MQTDAIIMTAPGQIGLGTLPLVAPKPADAVVDIAWSGISTGTEKLLWTGEMPNFPGMGYPLVPGYEATGTVVEAGPASGLSVGDTVFAPGANCYEGARGLFGGATRRLVSDGRRLVRIDPALGASGALLALAATARHAVAGPRAEPPELIVGHGVFGRLLARQTLAMGAPAPTVWEIDPARRGGADGYEVLAPDVDPRRDYATIFDASGAADLLDTLIGRLAKGGEIVLAGFYPAPLSFAFPPAFVREVRLRIAAEWGAEDMEATVQALSGGRLGLGGLITHTRAAADATDAYEQAFGDPECLKMILDWSAA